MFDFLLEMKLILFDVRVFGWSLFFVVNMFGETGLESRLCPHLSLVFYQPWSFLFQLCEVLH